MCKHLAIMHVKNAYMGSSIAHGMAQTQDSGAPENMLKAKTIYTGWAIKVART